MVLVLMVDGWLGIRWVDCRRTGTERSRSRSRSLLKKAHSLVRARTLAHSLLPSLSVGPRNVASPSPPTPPLLYWVYRAVYVVECGAVAASPALLHIPTQIDDGSGVVVAAHRGAARHRVRDAGGRGVAVVPHEHTRHIDTATTSHSCGDSKRCR